MKNCKKLLSLFVFLCLLLNLNAQNFADSSDSEERIQKFLWQKVDRASGYRVTIQQQNEVGRFVILQTVDTKDTTVELTLLPGEYRVSISPINVLGRASPIKTWYPFVIAKPDASKPEETNVLDLAQAEAVELSAKELAEQAIASGDATSEELLPAEEIPTEPVKEKRMWFTSVGSRLGVTGLATTLGKKTVPLVFFCDIEANILDLDFFKIDFGMNVLPIIKPTAIDSTGQKVDNFTSFGGYVDGKFLMPTGTDILFLYIGGSVGFQSVSLYGVDTERQKVDHVATLQKSDRAYGLGVKVFLGTLLFDLVDVRAGVALYPVKQNSGSNKFAMIDELSLGVNLKF